MLSVLQIILETLYEPLFHQVSTGFRPNKSQHTALRLIKKTFKRSNWVIEGNISQFFDKVDHGKLVVLLEKRIRDNKFINLIRRGLKAISLGEQPQVILWERAGTYTPTLSFPHSDMPWQFPFETHKSVVPTGKQVKSDLGVPKGGILAPLLSNIYLHELDE